MAVTTDRAIARNQEWRVVKITEVNPSTNHIAAQDQYGTNILIDVTGHPSLLQIPVVGELWTISRRGSDWILERRYENPDTNLPFTQMNPGDIRIEASGDITLLSGALTDTDPSASSDALGAGQFGVATYGGRNTKITLGQDTIVDGDLKIIGKVTDKDGQAKGVDSVFGRKGDIVKRTGDYDVTDITGAESSVHAATTYAPIVSPIFSGTPEAPTPPPGDNSTSLATTEFVDIADVAVLTTALAIPVLRGEAGGSILAGGQGSSAGSYICNMDSAPKSPAVLGNQVISWFMYNPTLDDPPSGYKTQWSIEVAYTTNNTLTGVTFTLSLWQMTAVAGGAGGYTETMTGSALSALNVVIGSTAGFTTSNGSWVDTNAAGGITTGNTYAFYINNSGTLATNSAFRWRARLHRRFIPV